MSTFILADNQELTSLGLKQLCLNTENPEIQTATQRKELVALLQHKTDAIVLLDYTLFDFNDISELIVLHQCYPDTHWILLSEELSNEFIHRITAESNAFSIVNKQCSIGEISQAINSTHIGKRYICHITAEQLVSSSSPKQDIRQLLTNTEIEILHEIALGKTTKEIAIDRNSSFHTVNTHRKNIFRKLEVNTVYEAIRFALRTGIIENTDYVI